MKIYYAHHLWKYNTPIEEYEIELIRKAFPNATIINPSTDIQQGREEAEIMVDCISLVEACDATVFSSMDGVVGKGVFDEVEKSKAVYYIFNNTVIPFAGSFEIIPDSDTKRIYATVRKEQTMTETERAIERLKKFKHDSINTGILSDVNLIAINYAITILMAQAARENPKPLTLDELRERDGKPVYCVYPDCDTGGEWFIVRIAAFAVMNDGGALLFRWFHEWRAYDYPPKNGRPND